MSNLIHSSCVNLLLFSSYIKTTRTRPCRGTIISRVYPKTFRRKLTLLAVRGFELGESVPLKWARLAHARWLTDWYEKWGIKTFYPSESCRFPRFLLTISPAIRIFERIPRDWGNLPFWRNQELVFSFL